MVEIFKRTNAHWHLPEFIEGNGKGPNSRGNHIDGEGLQAIV